MANTDTKNVVIIGSGPAGYTAAIYAARANLSPILIASSLSAGGELMNTTEVENFPGFPDGIMGPDLMSRMKDQAEKFGTEIVYDDAVGIDISGDEKVVIMESGNQLATKTVILATGSEYRKLGVPGEEKYSGYGVSWCATCDGAFFKDKTVAVVGGGDSAMEEALFLTKFSNDVNLIHRSDQFKASSIMLNRVKEHPFVNILTHKTIKEIVGGEKVNDFGIPVKSISSLRLHDSSTDSEDLLDVDGVFVAIGQDPRNQLAQGKIDLREDGTIHVHPGSSVTSIPGIFACGDIIDPHYRQAITAAASGCIAAQDVEHYLLKNAS